MQVSVYIATSFDGFIARLDGSLDWLPGADGNMEGLEDFGYDAFMAEVDALAMGRNTYETVRSFGAWPYAATPVYVLSRSLQALPLPPAGSEILWQQSPQELVSHLQSQSCRKLYVDGGLCIQSFLAAGLISDLTLTRFPVLLGQGKPLFGPLPQDVNLDHQETKSFASGAVQSRYLVAKN